MEKLQELRTWKTIGTSTDDSVSQRKWEQGKVTEERGEKKLMV